MVELGSYKVQVLSATSKAIQNQYTETTCILIFNNEKEIKESIPFTSATKIIKYLGINLPKETQELYTENYTIPMKEIKYDTNRWRGILHSWVGRINIVKMTTLPNAIYRFNMILTKLPIAFFTELEQKISQFIRKQKTPNSQSSLEKEEWSWRNQLS